MANVIKGDQIHHISVTDKEDSEGTNVIKAVSLISNIVSQFFVLINKPQLYNIKI